MTLQEQISRSKSRHAKPVKETWVKVQWIKDLTGWNKEKLRQAREQGLITYKTEGSGYLYKLESINPIFLKNHNPNQ